MMDFNQQQYEHRRKNYILRRSITDYGMGIVFFGVGILVAFAEKLGINVAIDDMLLRYMFAGISVLYGSFRIYRGFAKQYFYEE